MGKPGYTLEELKKLAQDFHEQNPNLQMVQRYAEARVTESVGVDRFLYWLEHGEYYVQRNTSYGAP